MRSRDLGIGDRLHVSLHRDHHLLGRPVRDPNRLGRVSAHKAQKPGVGVDPGRSARCGFSSAAGLNLHTRPHSLVSSDHRRRLIAEPHPGTRRQFHRDDLGITQRNSHLRIEIALQHHAGHSDAHRLPRLIHRVRSRPQHTQSRDAAIGRALIERRSPVPSLHQQAVDRSLRDQLQALRIARLPARGNPIRRRGHQ